MDLGERQFKFPLDKVLVIFDNCSTIKFYKKDELILQLDPTELSVLWGAYKEMKEECRNAQSCGLPVAEQKHKS